MGRLAEHLRESFEIYHCHQLGLIISHDLDIYGDSLSLVIRSREKNADMRQQAYSSIHRHRAVLCGARDLHGVQVITIIITIIKPGNNQAALINHEMLHHIYLHYRFSIYLERCLERLKLDCSRYFNGYKSLFINRCHYLFCIIYWELRAKEHVVRLDPLIKLRINPMSHVGHVRLLPICEPELFSRGPWNEIIIFSILTCSSRLTRSLSPRSIPLARLCTRVAMPYNFRKQLFSRARSVTNHEINKRQL